MAQRVTRARRSRSATQTRATTRTAPRLNATSELALRLLQSTLIERLSMGERAGLDTYAGKRNVATAMGYLDKITPTQYRQRYERNEVAQRVIESMPSATWRGGGELIEDDSPDTVTDFELKAKALGDRLNVWDVFRRADILAGLGRYAVILIGAPAPGNRLDLEMPSLRTPDAIAYLTAYGEEDALIKSEDLETDASSERFGLPKFYHMKRLLSSSDNTARKVHASRVIHVADGLLDDRLLGRPRLRAIWNRLDDLDKVVGAGSEAFWQRVQPGLQLKMDKDVVLDETAQKKLKTQMDEWLHGLRRIAGLRGGSLETVGDPKIADFSQQVDAIISLISAGSQIPKRILVGSERGELASQQDRSNWDQTISDRRDQFAAPQVVKQTIERFIKYGALPKPKQYEVRWPSIRNLDDQEIAETAAKWAEINQKAGETVVLPDEIRDRVLGMEPLENVGPPPTDRGVDETVVARRFLTKGRYARRRADAELIGRVNAALERAAGREAEPDRMTTPLHGLISTPPESLQRVVAEVRELRHAVDARRVRTTRRERRIETNSRGIPTSVVDETTEELE